MGGTKLQGSQGSPIAQFHKKEEEVGLSTWRGIGQLSVGARGQFQIWLMAVKVLMKEIIGEAHPCCR